MHGIDRILYMPFQEAVQELKHTAKRRWLQFRGSSVQTHLSSHHALMVFD